MIIVTGAQGFIGQALIEKLTDEIISIDIKNKEEIFQIDWSNISHVYHLGAVSSTVETNLQKIYDLNIDYSIRLFEKCIEHRVPVSYASSASVYGHSTSNEINPLNYYALSKATIDLWVTDNLARFNNVRGYRFFNVYGDNEESKGNQASPVYTFIKQAKTSGIIKIFDNTGDGKRDFIYVDDVCQTITNDSRPSGIYDLGTGKSHYFSELANHISKKYNAKIEIIPFPDYLKKKYQYNTQANSNHIIGDYIDVLEYIDKITD